MGFLQENERRLRAFARISSQVGENPAYVQGGGGNTSVKLDSRWMAIKASGYRLTDVTERDNFAVLDYPTIRDFYRQHEPSSDAQQEGNALAMHLLCQVEGRRQMRPSVEAGFHSLLDAYVIHSHSVYANLAGCAKEGERLFYEAMAGSGYAVRAIPYADPGAGLTFLIRDALRDAGGRLDVILMKNHGLVVTQDDAEACLAIHTDVNERLARAFGAEPFPRVAIRPGAEGTFVSDTPYLAHCLKSGKFGEDFFLKTPMYPDQMVFLAGQFRLAKSPGQEVPQGQCIADLSTGGVTYHMRQENARVIEETLCALVYIAEHIERAGLEVATLGDAAKDFIDGWESEKYRKTLALER